jgi:molybdopterin/thiamine biosynthesis adenylyltransferase
MKEFILRYQRHITLSGFGIEAQEKLSKAKVLVIGAGGLGCPALQYLVAAGVGEIGIVDGDTISLPNLNRQILYGQADIGKYKVVVAAEKLQALNNLVCINVFQNKCDQAFAIEHFPNYDIIIDATDNFASRYLINDACVLMNKPLVFGAVSQFEGQVAVFNVEQNGERINYRDIFPEPPKNDEVLSCAEGGVLGVLPGMIGVMQATETIKLITGIGTTIVNQLLTYNGLTQEMYKIHLVKNPIAIDYTPKSIVEFESLNYEWLCS